ncbi:Nucleoside 2-deoxyribosyltransferase [Candidatus Magnetomoraceae bacterium gMMP-15]
MPLKSLKILVAGGYDSKEQDTLDKPVDQIEKFCRCLGKHIIEQGHYLLTGCQTELDKVVAESAKLSIQDDNDQKHRIVSYVLQGREPVHNYGIIIQSDLPDWDIGGLKPTPPEVIRCADVVILIGGFFGTFQAANWARLDQKPLLPFVSFGGAAKEVYQVESSRFDKIYGSNINRLEYEKVLKPASINNYDAIASDMITLAEKIVFTKSVFVVMSFNETSQYKDLYTSIQRVCMEYDYDAKRVDDSNSFKRIIPEIILQIRQSAFVIADVTELKPNVFYELGFADGIGKKIILTAKEGTEVPFNINDFPILYWDSFADFEKELEERVKQIDF